MGILKKLFGSHTASEPLEMSSSRAITIIAAYSHAMTDGSSMVRDASSLPFPKHIIKQALLVGIRASTNPNLREQLKDSFVLLADWQEGAAVAPRSLKCRAEDLKDPVAAAACIAAVDEASTDAPNRVAAEASALVNELKELGL